jgi:hypothetical protein
MRISGRRIEPGARTGSLTRRATPLPTADGLDGLLALQRLAGNRAVVQLLREGESRGEEEGEGRLQSQVQVHAAPPDIAQEAASLRANAARSASMLQEMLESASSRDATTGDLMTLEASRAQLDEAARGMVERRRTLLERTHGHVDPFVQRDLDEVGEITRAVSIESASLRDRLATRIHRSQIDRLQTPSSKSERRAARVVGARDPRVTQADVREINNWVKGGWSTMNRHLFGAEDPKDVAARGAVLAQVEPTFSAAVPASDQTRILDQIRKQKWEMDVRSRVEGLGTALEKLPKFQGHTFRQASCRDRTVFGSAIRPGDLIRYKGFFATSMLRGAEGAGGGEEAWGRTQDKVYFDVSGVTGRDLGPYQQDLSGEREVLYPANSVFEVKAIESRNGAFFVIIQQVLVVPEGATVRDPWDGSAVPPPYEDVDLR